MFTDLASVAVPEKTPTLCVVPSTSMILYSNVLASGTAVTRKSPLYPVTPTPVSLVDDLTFLIRTLSPTFKLCLCSEMTVTVLELTEHVLMNLGFLLYSKSVLSMVSKVKSPTFLTPVVLDSWMMKLSPGSLELVTS